MLAPIEGAKNWCIIREVEWASFCTVNSANTDLIEKIVFQLPKEGMRAHTHTHTQTAEGGGCVCVCVCVCVWASSVCVWWVGVKSLFSPHALDKSWSKQARKLSLVKLYIKGKPQHERVYKCCIIHPSLFYKSPINICTCKVLIFRINDCLDLSVCCILNSKIDYWKPSIISIVA